MLRSELTCTAVCEDACRFMVLSGEGNALPRPPQRAEVHRCPVQGQETQLHRRVHQGGHLEGHHQENGESPFSLQV